MAVGRQVAKLEGQRLRGAAQAGLWEAASLHSWLEPEQGCEVRVLRLSRPSSHSRDPQELVYFISCPTKARL